MTERCFYFGCWNRPGHYLVGPHGVTVYHPNECKIVRFGDTLRHIDASLAPTRNQRTGAINCAAFAPERYERHCLQRYARHCLQRYEELPQGQYLLHHLLDNGFTAIQWWDRNQGDSRMACNSTILLEGKHTAEEMVAALSEHFPSVLANLSAAGITLTQVFVTP